MSFADVVMASVSGETIAAIWRIESPRLLGALVRFTGDVDRAEDLAQEALLSALEIWPGTGLPENPGAWLMVTAKNKGIDQARRQKMVGNKHEQMALEEPPASAEPPEALGDDVLRLILATCHPVLAREARVALTLRLVGGLSTEEIARAFLVPEPTIAQRIVRAKRTLKEARVPFEVPRGLTLHERLPSVFEVIYLIFNEGYAASRGDDWMRPTLCQDAMRLGRVLAALVPDESEVHGLVALMELQASRMRTRTDREGNPILLMDQNRARWDHSLISHGLGALAKAEQLSRPLGPYSLQAAIAGCHARAKRPQDTDWPRIVALYDALVEVTGSPVVQLNRAVAVGMAYGAAAGLSLADQLNEEGALERYHLLPAVRGEFLEKLGRVEEAAEAFDEAAAMTMNEREKGVLEGRARSLRTMIQSGIH